MPSNILPPSLDLIAFLFKDADQKLQTLHLSPDFRLTDADEKGYVLRQRHALLPDGFFGPSISSMTALVGRNSSGKSTVLADIARILCGKRPVSAGCALVLRHGDELFQLRYALRTPVFFDNTELPVKPANDLANLKVVYFSSSYDPLQRQSALLKSDTQINFADLSNQYVYTDPRRQDKDFEDKLAYLQQARDSVPLELSAEGKRTRSISFTASIAYDPLESAQQVLETLLERLPDPHLESLKETLRSTIGLPDEAFESDNPPVHGIRAALRMTGVDYFGVLRNFLDDRLARFRLTENAVVFLLVVGRLAAVIKSDRGRNHRLRRAVRLEHLFDAPDLVLDYLLGEGFIHHANIIAQHAKPAGHDDAFASAAFPSGRPYVRVRINGVKKSKSRKGQELEAADRELFQTFIEMRRKQVAFEIDFNGLSDGQRSLLTFASRYTQETTEQWAGSTVLLVDEHEQGLHPEWQRQFIKQLCHLIATQRHTAGRTQVVLSSHSPFVVTDLPATCVNVVGGQVPANERTFGANLLELLLSPLFMNRTTGEFAVEKVQAWLEQIQTAESTHTLLRIRPLLDLIGDKLTHNYLQLKLSERLAVLENQSRRVNHD